MDHYSILEPESPDKKQKSVPAEAAWGARNPTGLPGEEISSAETAPPQFPGSETASTGQESGFAKPALNADPVPHPDDSGAELDAALQALVQKAQYISNATGAALALRQGADVVCRAASGSSAPDRGARLQIKSGLTAECLRSGELMHCHNVMLDARVDMESCKRLGIESIIITPIRNGQSLVGVLELFSSHAYSFQERDIETVRGVAEQISRMLEQEKKPVASPPEAPVLAALPLEEGPDPPMPAQEEGGNSCTNCGAKISSDAVFCTECGFFQEGKPAKPTAEARETGWKARLTGRRMVVPAAFVAMALLVAVAPIPHTSNGTAVRRPTQQAAVTVPAGPGAGSAVNQKTSAAQAPANTAVSDTSPANNPSIAKSVKQLLGGVSSDFSKLLPVNEKAEPPSNGDPNLKVWVDTRKGFYYCPGDEQYGHTGKGSFMTQKEAEANYYIPALIKPCM